MKLHVSEITFNWAINQPERGVAVGLGSIMLFKAITVHFQLNYSTAHDRYWVNLGNSRKGKNGKFFDGAWIEDRDLRDLLVEVIVKAYMEKTGKLCQDMQNELEFDNMCAEEDAKIAIAEASAENQEEIAEQALEDLMKAC